MPRKNRRDDVPYRISNYLTDEELEWPFAKQLIQYFDYCKYERDFTEQTMTGKVSALNHFAKWSKLHQIEDLSNDIVREYTRWQSDDDLSAYTKNNRSKHISAMAAYFTNEVGISIPNFDPSKLHKQHENRADRKAYPRDVIYEVLKYADRREWLFIKICFDCGLRINELRNMRIKDIDGDKIKINGKGRKIRYAVVSDEVKVRLEDWIKREAITDYIWPSTHKSHAGKPMSVNTIRKYMQKAFRAAGVMHMKPHELRISYATDLVQVGAKVRDVQQGLGHSSIKTTEIYLRDLDDTALRRLYKLKYSAEAPELR